MLRQAPPRWPPDDEQVRRVLARLAAEAVGGRDHHPHGEALREALSRYLNVPHVLLYCSGTIAVEAALRGVGVQAGDRVMIAAYDFPGNFRAIEAIGARPLLVDPAEDNWSFDPRALDAVAEQRPRAAIVSHLHAGLVPMADLLRRAADAGDAVVEDACQVPGAIVDGRPAGSWGNAGVWSFGGSKLLSAGRGGALFTSDDACSQRAKLFSQRGNDAFPLSEMQAAVLLPQLERLDERNMVRKQAVDRLLAAAGPLPGWRSLTQDAANQTAFYKLPWRIDLPESNFAIAEARNLVLSALQAEGVPIDAGFRGFAGRGDRRCDRAGELPIARRLAAGTMLLHHPILLSDNGTLDPLAEALRRVADAWRSGDLSAAPA